ncbi:MAG: hypothetical protein KIS67_23455 [Verrucomicrobiae bacterium]|nr:hypothetical protein [Verrucomicrobiae bacterium]
MIVIFPVCDRIKLLPYFLRYYSSLGADEFACALYNGRKNPLFEEILSFRTQYNLHIDTSVACCFESYRGAHEVKGLNVIRETYASKARWYCIADLDEFHFFNGKNLMDIASEAEQAGYEAVHGIFFDRIAADGTFPEIQGSLDNTFPMVCDLSRCAGLACRKITMAKGHVQITAGHHSVEANIWRNVAQVHHFKWSAGVYEMMVDKYRRYKSQGLPWATHQLPRLLELIENGVDLSNPKLNTREAARLGI